MIHFFKKKPFLLDFISNDYVDIHSHLLPNIDDGAIDLEDTTNLIAGLQSLGFKKFITTPHIMSDVWNNTRKQIEEKVQNTVSNIVIKDLKNNLKAAAEYMIDAEFRELIKKEPLLTLRDNYVLVEISYLNPPIQLHEILFELITHGYQPVLAHPERYNFYHNNLDEYTKLKNAGCLFQINMLSLNGYYGSNVTKASDYLLGSGLIDFIGSDVHHRRHLEFLEKRVVIKNYKQLDTIFQNNSFFDF